MSCGPIDRYYQVLGIDRTASADDVKRAHRDMAQVWHPDRFTANPRLQKIAEQKLREINEAYTAIRSGRTPAAGPAQSIHTHNPPGIAAWLQISMQAIGAAAVVFAVIMFASSVHRWITDPPAPPIVADLNRAPQPSDTHAPAGHHGGNSKAELEQTSIANGTEMFPARGRRGAGSLSISNETDRDAVAMLLDAGAPDAVVRMVYVSAGRKVSLDGIAPGLYRLQLNAGAQWNWRLRDFTWRRTAPRMVGPLSFTQIQSAGQVRGEQYRIVLRPDGAGTGEDTASDGALRA